MDAEFLGAPDSRGLTQGDSAPRRHFQLSGLLAAAGQSPGILLSVLHSGPQVSVGLREALSCWNLGSQSDLRLFS
jgi:hypothetical protein